MNKVLALSLCSSVGEQQTTDTDILMINMFVESAKNKPRKVIRMIVRGPEGFELMFREGTDLKWEGVSHMDMGPSGGQRFLGSKNAMERP